MANWMPRFAAALIVFVNATGCSASGNGRTINGVISIGFGGFEVNGKDTLSAEAVDRVASLHGGESCRPSNSLGLSSGGAFDWVPGAQVLIEDASGKLVGKTSVAGSGKFRNNRATVKSRCAFAFHAKVTDSRFYKVSVGETSLTISADEASREVEIFLQYF